MCVDAKGMGQLIDFQVFVAHCWVLGSGLLVLSTRFWVLGSGCWGRQGSGRKLMGVASPLNAHSI
jgi:hypothetical protein